MEPDPPSPVTPAHRARRRELIWLAVMGGGGLFVMPFVIYLIGTRTLGPYEGGGLGSFLGGLYGDFFHLHWGAWALLIGPYLLTLLIRWLLLSWRRRRPDEAASAPPAT
jgi:hypothetical protein